MQRRTLAWAFGTSAACLLSLVVVRAQTPTAADKPLMAEQVFKNVQVLKGIPVNDFMGTMGIFSAALGMSCEDCHKAGDTSWENYAVDNPRKQMARAMVVMMATINKTHFGGRQGVTCFSCHRGTDRPKGTPNLDLLYGQPPLPDPRDIIEQSKLAPPPDEVLDRYLQAIGGAQRAAALTSYTARGTSTGYGPDGESRQLELYARAPNQRTTIVHTASGDSTATFDGRTAWVAAPFRPVPVLALAGTDLDGARLDAELAFPARIKQVLTKWRTGLPTVIGDREVQVVQGTGAGGITATLYFDGETGLLVRQVRFVPSPVGNLPTQVDYSDYREVAGVKMPFKWTVTWLDGRDNIELTEVLPNVPVDASRFARPAPPVAPPAKRVTP
jgi:hypothetical protein